MSLAWEESQLDARFRHPFTCVVAGPSGSGKTTWVKNLLQRQDEFIDAQFDYIYVFIGTDVEENQVVLSLKNEFPEIVEIFELNKIYKSGKDIEERFPSEFKKLVREKKGTNGCVVFDDLMSELSKSGMLLDLFTKYAAHSKISTIHISQNVFHKGAGKHASDNVTIYRNIHVLVLFKTPLDNSIFKTVAGRMGEKLTNIMPMIKHVLSNHRYIVIRGDFKSDERLRYCSDIFATEPVPHMRAFSLLTKTKPVEAGNKGISDANSLLS